MAPTRIHQIAIMAINELEARGDLHALNMVVSAASNAIARHHSAMGTASQSSEQRMNSILDREEKIIQLNSIDAIRYAIMVLSNQDSDASSCRDAANRLQSILP